MLAALLCNLNSGRFGTHDLVGKKRKVVRKRPQGDLYQEDEPEFPVLVGLTATEANSLIRQWIRRHPRRKEIEAEAVAVMLALEDIL